MRAVTGLPEDALLCPVLQAQQGHPGRLPYASGKQEQTKDLIAEYKNTFLGSVGGYFEIGSWYIALSCLVLTM